MEPLYRIASAHREAELTSATGLIDAGAQLGSVIIAVTILTLMTALVVFAFVKVRARARSTIWLGRSVAPGREKGSAHAEPLDLKQAPQQILGEYPQRRLYFVPHS